MENSQLMPGSIENIDNAATLAINGLHSGPTDAFWLFMSDKYVWIPAYAAVLFFLIKRLGWKKAAVMVLSIVSALVICDQVSYHVKYAVGRLRPCFNAEMIDNGLHWLENRGHGFFGFFSGHASNAFSFAICSTMAFRNDRSHTYSAYGYGIYMWATLVAVSRIFVGKHFLGDILVGTAFGLAAGFAAGCLARWISIRFMDRHPATAKDFFRLAVSH